MVLTYSADDMLVRVVTVDELKDFKRSYLARWTVFEVRRSHVCVRKSSPFVMNLSKS